jgi:hypothetical protein
MAKFAINVPVETEEAKVEVEIDPDTALAVGRHRFSLVVTDDSGNESQEDTIEVIVADRESPTAVLQGPDVASFGKSFGISGARSFDVGGGTIKRYRFTYLGPSLR